MDCPICGHKLEEHDSFCSNCGHYALPLQDYERQVPVIDPPPDAPEDGSTVMAPCPEIPEKSAQTQKKVAERLYPPPETDPEAVRDAFPERSEPSSAKKVTPPEIKKEEKRAHGSPAPSSTAPAAPPKALHRMKVLAIVLSGLAVVSIAVAVFVVVTTSSLRVQLNKAQKEATTAQGSVDSLETQVTELTQQLETAKAENGTLSQQVTDLTGQVGDLETTINQSQYDKEAAERDLKEAKASLTEAQDAKTALEAELASAKDSLTAAQDELSTVKEENETLTNQVSSYQDEISFYDAYVVFVMLGSSEKYYHKYNCSHFTQRNFLAYSTKLAEANGYAPCPDCIG